MSRPAPARQAIRDVRHFNRFYTKQIGLLQDHMSSPFSLTEVRILYEIAHRRQPTASDLIAELGLDPGYLSRSLTKLQQQQLLRRERSSADGRQSFLTLTPKGQSTFRPLETRSNRQIATMLSRLTPEQQNQLLSAMRLIEERLDATRGLMSARIHTPCARTSRATWVGSCTGTGTCTGGNTGTMNALRVWWLASSRISFSISIQDASAAGSLRKTDKRWEQSSW